MNKKISRIALGLSLSSIIVLGILINSNSPKDKLKDINGDRNSLGDVTILSQERLGFYSTKIITLYKDNYEVNNNSKQLANSNEVYSKISNENRTFLRNSVISDNNYYETNDSIGYIGYLDEYYDNEDVYIMTTIHEKNLKTNKTTEVDIKLPTKFKQSNNSNYKSIIAKYKDDLYLVVHGVDGILYNDSGEIVDEGRDFIKFYKINLDNKEVKELDIKTEFNENGKYKVVEDGMFVNNNKIYFKMENKETKKYNLAYYDLASQKVETIKTEISLETDMSLYESSVEDNKLNLLYTNKDIKDKIALHLTTIDLKSGDILNDNVVYEMDKLNRFNDATNFRVVDNKLYVTLKSHKIDKQEVRTKDREYADSIAVFDEKTKKLLYVGEYSQGSGYYEGNYILKNEEV
ncbi:hypothetical protein CHL78_011640 [Romboutsia weinsteinii]|uniref:Uncharacterized protein n=1 Tax=Romboutsia weinsteinii TaxID=2020949 RepID=A0A371J299_9FIRM|nr:hypothetical protein [Romboutsia weinsteinii]RDY26845.1 hypothetical protein CHL78_011640 [Romboutsia weinsteinii]